MASSIGSFAKKTVVVMALQSRLKREFDMLTNDPPYGIGCWPNEEDFRKLTAQIQGPEGTVYSKGTFELEIHITDRYPFEPPKVRFVTPIYHPNIDNGGRICLDTLKMPPKGAWRPSVNLSTLLCTIRLLMAEPNPDDGLMPDITDMFINRRARFDTIATEWTSRHATKAPPASSSSNSTNIEKARETNSGSTAPPASISTDGDGGTDPKTANILEGEGEGESSEEDDSDASTSGSEEGDSEEDDDEGSSSGSEEQEDEEEEEEEDNSRPAKRVRQ